MTAQSHREGILPGIWSRGAGNRRARSPHTCGVTQGKEAGQTGRLAPWVPLMGAGGFEARYFWEDEEGSLI